MLNFYDFEVFEKDWLVVIINPVDKLKEIIVNDSEKFKDYFDRHCTEIWIGYNNRRYDQYIAKGIYLDMDPKKISDWIIRDNRYGYQFSSLFNQVPMINFDVMLKGDSGLKALEGFLGENIKETSVPFDIDRKLTEDEIKETIKYCTWDVERTIDVWLERKSEFDAALGLVKIFDLPLSYMGKTGAQRVAKILGGLGKRFGDDEFEFPIVDTLRLDKYKACKDWYRNPDNFNYSKMQKLDIAGVPHILKWGGIHGAIKKYYGEGLYVMIDVTGYYPSLQLRYKFGYRNMGCPENFEKIHGENLRFKQAGDKKARLPYKIADNAISGQLKDVFSPLYDPRDNNAICVNGQLLLVDLIEKLEKNVPTFELIQSNTDGILIKIANAKYFDNVDDTVYEWEERTGMQMEFDIFNKVFQKDVNNYLLIGKDGKTKTKGKYTKSLSKVDFDLPIVNKAMVDFMSKSILPENTIEACDDLIMFQKIVKLSGKYWAVWHNGNYTFDKCHRVFASKDKKDTYIGKCKKKGATIEKFGDTPDSCFLDNENVKEKSVPDKLDKQWYIDLTYHRLEQYGIEV